MRNLFSQLTKDAQARFLEELNYLNLGEIRSFCSDRGIPYKILAGYPNGKTKTTKDIDRKPIVLARIRHYLATGKVGQPTCIPAGIVRHGDPPARPRPRDRLYYRWYSKKHTGIMRSLGELTDGRFRDGAVARVLAMEFWTRGEAPTLAEFARAWTQAKADAHRLLTPEYAYLTDLKHKQVGSEWKSLRKTKAESALQTLARIAPLRPDIKAPSSALRPGLPRLDLGPQNPLQTRRAASRDLSKERPRYRRSVKNTHFFPNAEK